MSKTNRSSATLSEFDDVLEDEVDSGSELEDSYWDDMEELEDDVEQHDEELEDQMDIEPMPFLSMDESGQLHRFTTVDQSVAAPQPSLSRTPSPPPYSPLSSPLASPNANPGQESNMVLFFDLKKETADQDDQDWNPRASSVSTRGRSRGQTRSRGTRSRGGNQGRGCAPAVQRPAARERRLPAASAVGGDFMRREGLVMEVCLDDEDVPPALRQMVRELEARRVKSRQARTRAEKADDDQVDESAVVSELFGGDQSARNFVWSPMATFEGTRCSFNPGFEVGPTRNCSDAYDAFRQFWDDDILEHIVRETNRYALGLKEKSARFARDWYETNVHEILILFSFWMMLGIIRMPSIKSCFSNSQLLKTDIFRLLMTQSRYWILNRALHFVDNGKRTPDSSKLFSLGPILDHLNSKFKEFYNPGQDIVIDESLTLWKGKLGFRQYIKTKAARFGIKTFELCESATGYLWSFVIYQGKDNSNTSSLPKNMEVVVRLIRPLLNKGYRLFMDNWFNSPILARFLKRNNTDCVGTLRKTRMDVPPFIQLANIPQGTFVARHSGDVSLMAYQDKKTVYTISTHHNTGVKYFKGKPGKPAHYKPDVIADYNANMGGVDRKDQMLEPYLLERKRCQKWYKKMFKRLLNISIFNSHIIYQKSASQQNMTKQLAYRLDLVQQIMQHHLDHGPNPRMLTSVVRPSALPQARLIGKHFVVRGESELPAGATRNSRRNCVWCAVEHRRSRTIWVCDNCEVPLCLEGCFKKFHT